MRASPIPIYLGCAGVIVGGLGLGVQHLVGGNSISATNTPTEQRPLFARSVEEAALPAQRWPSQNPHVAFYEPTIELMTQTAAAPPTESRAAPTRNMHEERAAAPREVVRDLPRQQTRRSSKRARARAREDVTASAEPDPRDARAQADAENPPRRFDRRYRDRRHPEERQYRPGRQRVVVREDIREPERRYIRAPEPRENFGPNPPRMFGE